MSENYTVQPVKPLTLVASGKDTIHLHAENLVSLKRFVYYNALVLTPRYKVLQHISGRLPITDTGRIVGYDVVDCQGQHKGTVIKWGMGYDIVMSPDDITMDEKDRTDLIV